MNIFGRIFAISQHNTKIEKIFKCECNLNFKLQHYILGINMRTKQDQIIVTHQKLNQSKQLNQV